MPCPFTGPKMFDPNFLSQPKNLTAFSASSKMFVPAQKPILLNANHLFVWHKMFVIARMYLNNILVWHKKFGPAQNILETLKGQGLSRAEIIIKTVLTIGTIKKRISRKSEMFFILSENKI
jgi:hypothetical protein